MKLITLCLLFVCFHVFSQDKLSAIKTTSSMTIDGLANEEVWGTCPWYTIDQPWMKNSLRSSTLFTSPTDADFKGNYKLAWDKDYLYLLADITDDVFRDDHVNPIADFWNDDCLEIFLDENRSKGAFSHVGNHFEAFAYHLAKNAIDVVDWGPTVNVGVPLNDHIKTAISNVPGTTKYLWECRIKIFDNTFFYGGANNTPVVLNSGKILGFSVAYCDNDAGTREDFIGSGVVPGTDKNQGFKTADYYQELKLIDGFQTADEFVHSTSKINIYPNPAKVNEPIFVQLNENVDLHTVIKIHDMNGKLIYQTSTCGQKNVKIQFNSTLNSGVYVFSIENLNGIIRKKMIVND